MTARVLVARHGAAEYETDTVTDAGGSLTPAGRAQSRELGERLTSSGIERIYASSMSRATQTAELVAHRLGVGVTVRDGLREYGVGDFEGVPCEPDPITPIYDQWVAGDLAVPIPGSETGADGIARMTAVLEEAAAGGGTALVVGHGGIICVTLPALARNVTIQQVHGHHLPNCAVVEAERDDDGWTVRRWPDLDL